MFFIQATLVSSMSYMESTAILNCNIQELKLSCLSRLIGPLVASDSDVLCVLIPHMSSPRLDDLLALECCSMSGSRL